MIFVAACKDGEEMIYPIAFGFGDGESDNSWTWFLSRLREIIGGRHHLPSDLIIVSDRHKSITNVMGDVFPEVPHVFCFFHLKQNLKKHFRKQKDVEDMFYLAAYCYTRSDCDRYLEQIQRVCPQMHKKLIDVGMTK